MHGSATAPALHRVEDPSLCSGPRLHAAAGAVPLVLDDKFTYTAAQRREAVGEDFEPFARADELGVVNLKRSAAVAATMLDVGGQVDGSRCAPLQVLGPRWRFRFPRPQRGGCSRRRHLVSRCGH